MTPEEEQRRAYFRLRYPEEVRPQFELEAELYPVCEISEAGIRIQWPDDEQAVPAEVVGTLKLPEDSVALEGRVLRRDQGELVIALSQGVPFPVMVKEQRRMLKAFPGFFGRES